MTNTSSSRTFIKDVTYPDGARVQPGEAIVKVWRVRNSGVKAWNETFRLEFSSGHPMTEQPSMSLPLTEPGEITDITVPMTAPNIDGRYRGYWQFIDDQNVPFGIPIWIDIVVGDNDVIVPQIGVHDIEGGQWMAQVGISGWCLHTVALGTDSQVIDVQGLADAGIMVLVRLNHGYGRTGTIPDSDRPHVVDAFVSAAIETMQNSHGVAGFIVGNEPNNPAEFPEGKPITPAQYAALYNQIWANKPSNINLGPAATDPYFGPGADNRQWWTTMLDEIYGADFLTVHCKTQDSNPLNVFSEDKFTNPPLLWQYYHLRAFQTLLDVVPLRFRKLPVYATEVNPQRHNDMLKLGWQRDQGARWVEETMKLFQEWNRSDGSQDVHAVIFYRFGIDDWAFQGFPEVLNAIHPQA